MSFSGILGVFWASVYVATMNNPSTHIERLAVSIQRVIQGRKYSLYISY